MSMLDLEWAALYVTGDLETSWYRDRAGNPDMLFVPEEYRPALAEFRSTLLARNHRVPFRIELGVKKERLRVKPLFTSMVDPLFVCRRYRAKPKSLSDLGVPQGIVSWLLDKPMAPGLILVVGPQESGKTTFASAFVLEHTTRHGGAAMTIEAPIEMELEGHHGRGVIYQTEIEEEALMGAALRGLLHTGARLFYPGEVTHDATAKEVQMIAGRGNAVITTFHANDALGGLRQFADAAGGNYDTFAEVLSAVFFLKLEHNARSERDIVMGSHLPGDASPPEQYLTVSPLVMTPETRAAIGSALRSGTFQNLAGEMSRQKDLFMRGGIPR